MRHFLHAVQGQVKATSKTFLKKAVDAKRALEGKCKALEDALAESQTVCLRVFVHRRIASSEVHQSGG